MGGKKASRAGCLIDLPRGLVLPHIPHQPQECDDSHNEVWGCYCLVCDLSDGVGGHGRVTDGRSKIHCDELCLSVSKSWC